MANHREDRVSFNLCLTRWEIGCLNEAQSSLSLYRYIQTYHDSPEVWKALVSIAEFANAAQEADPRARYRRLTSQITFQVILLRWEVEVLQQHAMADDSALSGILNAALGLVVGAECTRLLQRITIVAGSALEAQDMLEAVAL